MYYRAGMSVPEIASALNNSQKKIREQMDKYGIKRSTRVPYAKFHTTKAGYEIWTSTKKKCKVHQLQIIAAGADPHEVFQKDTVVHHKNRVKWDNRESNLELMTNSEHMKRHWEEGDFDNSNIGGAYTAEELLMWIDSFVELNGFSPSSVDARGWPGPKAETYRNHFGSFAVAVKAAGYEPRGNQL